MITNTHFASKQSHEHACMSAKFCQGKPGFYTFCFCHQTIMVIVTLRILHIFQLAYAFVYQNAR